MISPAEEQELIDFIKSKGCRAWQEGRNCEPQPGKAEVVEGMHDPCRRVEQVLEIAERI